MNSILEDLNLFWSGIKDSANLKFLFDNQMQLIEGKNIKNEKLWFFFFGEKASIKKSFIEIIYINSILLLSILFFKILQIYLPSSSIIEIHYTVTRLFFKFLLSF